MATETRALMNPAVLSNEVLGVDIAAEIAAQQQAIVPGVPRIPQPFPQPFQLEEIEVQGKRIEPKSAAAPQALTTGQMIREQVSNTDQLATQLAGQIETNLGLQSGQAEATTNAILTIANADKKIKLQQDVEANRIEDQVRRVAERATSEQNQTRLMDQFTAQNADLQKAINERQAEAEEGGFGFFLKSMLNMEIYGTPGGRDDIAINAMATETNATLAEIQGITTATTNFAEASRLTQDLHNDVTIHAGQQKITAQAQLDLSTAKQKMFKDNAEQMQMLMSLDNSRLTGLNALLNYENSVEARADRTAQREFNREQLSLTRDRFELSKLGIQLDNEYKVLRNSVAGGETGLAAESRLRIKTMTGQLEALSLTNAERAVTSADRIAVISGQVDVQNTQLEGMRFELSTKKDLAPDVKKKLEQDIKRGEANLIKLDRDNRIEQVLEPFRLRQAEQNQKVMDQQIRMNELNILISEGTQTEKLNAVREKALLEASIAEDTRVSVEQGAVAIGIAQDALFGFMESEETRAQGVSESGNAGVRYDLLENIGLAMSKGQGMNLGDTPYKAWISYNVLTSDGSTMRDIPAIVALQEVNERVEARYALPAGKDGALIRPSDPAETAANFNAEGDKYIAEIASNVDWKDKTNPLTLDPFSILEVKAPGLLDDPFYKKIVKPAGQEEANPERLVQLGLDAMLGPDATITVQEVAAGLTAIYNSGKFNSQNFQHGLSAAGFNAPSGINIRLPKPGSIAPGLGLMGASPAFSAIAAERSFPGTSPLAREGAQLIKSSAGRLVTINAMDQTQWTSYLIARATSRRITGAPTAPTTSTTSTGAPQ